MKEKSLLKSPGTLASLLAMVFVALKLTGYIAWSWWWVLSPLWISALIGLFILFIIVGASIIGQMLK